MSEMPRCKTCKWWDRYREEEWATGDRAESDTNIPVESGTLAYAIDHERYSAMLRTHRDFGCIMHEPRENAK